MKTIIVPTDFSDASVNAAFYAVKMALHIHANITLLHILTPPLTFSEIPLPPGSYEDFLEEADKSLSGLKDRLETYSNYTLEITCRTSTGSILEEIKKLNEENGLFAVIMGTSGAGATEAFFLGSFSLTAAKHLDCPLIVVPPDYGYKDIKKIGLACDMENVLEHLPVKGIRTLFEHFEAKLEVLYVSRPFEKMFPEVLRESKFIQTSLASYHPDIRITTHADIKQGLEDFVHKSGIDLLLLLPKERNFVEGIFHKSVTKKMVLHPTVPIMVLHH